MEGSLEGPTLGLALCRSFLCLSHLMHLEIMQFKFTKNSGKYWDNQYRSAKGNIDKDIDEKIEAAIKAAGGDLFSVHSAGLISLSPQYKHL